MSKDNGGPAFPAGRRFDGAEGWQTEEGMTLRDYFAAKAMQGLIAGCEENRTLSHQESAGWAYLMADAMMEVRK